MDRYFQIDEVHWPFYMNENAIYDYMMLLLLLFLVVVYVVICATVRRSVVKRGNCYSMVMIFDIFDCKGDGWVIKTSTTFG